MNYEGSFSIVYLGDLMMEKFKDIVGGKWWKIDFHLHTPASSDYGHGDCIQKGISPEQFLFQCMKKELDCIVITDHGNFDWIPKLVDTLKKMRSNPTKEFRDIVIFPGIELNVTGIHLLGIFDPEVKYESLIKILGSIGYDDSKDTTAKSLTEVMKIIIDNNGIAIPAHVDKPCGLFSASSQTRNMVYSIDGLLALEVIDVNNAHDGLYTDSKLKLSHVIGSDSHNLESIAEKFTWVKMGKPNIEALKLALHDVEDGIKRYIGGKFQVKPNRIHGNTYIKSLRIYDGKYIGRGQLSPYQIEFSPWLNTIIGGRGSGKSTIINFLRLILNRIDELPQELSQEFKNFINVSNGRKELGMILNNTKVEVTMFIDGVKRELRWEKFRFEEFTEQTSSYQSIDDSNSLISRFPVRIFSQKQLYEITKDTKILFKYLDAEWDFTSWKLKLQKEKTEYKQCCQRLKLLKSQKEKAENVLKTLSDVLEKLKIYEDEYTKQIFSEQKILNKNYSIIKNEYEKYSPIIENIDTLKNAQLPILTEDLSSLDGESREKFTKWIKNFSDFLKEFNSIVNKYSSISVSFEELMANIRLGQLIMMNVKQMKEISQSLRDLGEDDTANKYDELVKEKERLEKELLDYKNLDSEIFKQENVIEEKLRLIDDLIVFRYSERKRIIKSWNEKNNNLQLDLKLFGDLDENERIFREIIDKTAGEFEADILEYNANNVPVNGIIFRVGNSFIQGESIEKCIERLNTEKYSLVSFIEMKIFTVRGFSSISINILRYIQILYTILILGFPKIK